MNSYLVSMTHFPGHHVRVSRMCLVPLTVCDGYRMHLPLGLSSRGIEQ